MGRILEAASAVSHDASTWQGEQLSMLVCPPAPIVHLERRRNGEANARLPTPGRCTSDATGLLLSVRPYVYLCVGGEHHSATLVERFQVVVDVSSAWTQLAFEGAKVVELLRKGCAVDLHPHMFPAGACCVTGFAKMRVVLWRSSTEDRYDMLVGRSYALSLWSWLLEAAAPYGGQQTKELSQ